MIKLKSPLFGKKAQLQTRFLSLLEKISDAEIREASLPRRLASWAAAIGELELVDDVLVIVTDHGLRPLLLSHQHRDHLRSDHLFEELRQIRRTLESAPEMDWGVTEIAGESRHLLRLRHDSEVVGVLALSSRMDNRETATAQVLDRIRPHLARAVAQSMNQLECRLRHDMQRIAVCYLTPTEPRPAEIVEQLCRVMSAESVTLFVEEQARLCLSGTTDRKLRDDAPSYRPGEGFTGYVFEQGKTVLLFDATNQREVEDTTGISDREQRPQAEKIALSGQPFHLLAVPTYATDPQSPESVRGFSGPTSHRNGVLRITRTNRPFAEYERRALEDFAVLLGNALARAWEIFLGRCLWDAGTEAVALTRYEPRQGPDRKGTSRVVDFDRRADTLFRGTSDQDPRGIDVRHLYQKTSYKWIRSQLAAQAKTERKELGPVTILVRQLDGKLVDVEASYRLLTSPFVLPRTDYTLSLLRDIQSRQKILDQHARLIELLSVRKLAYFRADEQGKTLESSPAESEMLGWSEAELLEWPRERLYSDAGQQMPLLDRLHRENGRVVQAIRELKRRDGSTFTASGFMRLLKDDAGDPSGYEGIYEDVTDKILLQRLLALDTDRILSDRHLYEQLTRDTRLNLDYMTSLSHQLRTPLSALIQNIHDFEKQLVEHDPLLIKIRRLLGQMNVCNDLVSNLSYVDRILKGEAFQVRPVRLSRLAKETRLNFSQVLSARRMKMIIDDDEIEELFGDFKGSPELMRQVIENLLDNAVKYSEQGTRIHVGAYQGRHERILSMSNVGLPIPPDQRRLVFERGFRNKVASSASDGTGLGLWIVDRIVRIQGGQISCSSEPSGEDPELAQVTFRISFPTHVGRA